MADELAPIEQIPDDAFVYMRAHSQFFRDEELQPGVFRIHLGGMSVDWDKYATPEETRKRAKAPEQNAVLSMPVRGIRAIDSLRVEHKPLPENRAHSEVLNFPDGGEDLTEIRVRLRRISDVVVRISKSSS